MTDQVEIRRATTKEYDMLGAVMYEAIHNGPTLYTDAQSKAWAPTPYRGQEWADRLSEKAVFIATRAEEILGFMTIEPGGYIDFAYILPNAQGRGLFRLLFTAVLTSAQQAEETQLSTHASLMAQPAFTAMGFRVERHETVTRNGQSLKRAHMIKPL